MRPRDPQEHEQFIKRLKEIATDFGTRAGLEKRAELPSGSLYNYEVKGSEPTRPVLVEIAKAAGVSTAWLAEGTGRKERSLVPPGYEEIPFYDLRKSAWRMHPLVSGDRAGAFIINAEWIGSGARAPFAIEAPNEINGSVKAGDIVVISQDQDCAELDPTAIYLVSWKNQATLRRLRTRRSAQRMDHLGRGDAVLGLYGERPSQVTRQDWRFPLAVLRPGSSRIERVIEADAPERWDFGIHGRVIWRAGRP